MFILKLNNRQQLLALIVIVRGFECKNITGTKLEAGLVAKYVMESVCTNKINSDSSERKYIHLTNVLVEL